MSHFTTIKTQIRDIDALCQAVGEMGYALILNAEARGFVNNTTKGDYVIQLKGPYDIALNPAVPHDSGQPRFRDDDGPLWQPTGLELRKATV